MQQVHRPGPLHQTNKGFKCGKHNRKTSITSQIKTKTISKFKQTREGRLNQVLQSRRSRREKTIEEKRKIGTENYPPLVVGILDLYKNSSSSFIDGLKSFEAISIKPINKKAVYILSSKLKMRFKLLALDSESFDETLDLVKGIDVLLMIHRPNSVEYYDYTSSPLFKSIYIHCLPTIIHVLDGLQSSVKQLMNAKKILRQFIKDEKVNCIEKTQDYLQLIHHLGHCRKHKSSFKNARPLVSTDKVEVVDGLLTFTGYVEKRVLNPNDIIHIVGYGDYLMKKIDILPEACTSKNFSLDVVQTLLPDRMKQESLEQENHIDPMDVEQTWPTDEELTKKLPPVTSGYQGAWINNDLDGDAYLEDEEEPTQQPDESSADEDRDIDEYDDTHCVQKEAKLLNEMFPDEIDTPQDVPARVRFARYRALKSFRTSHWDPQENLPSDYSRIFQFQNFEQTKRRILNERSKDGADPGQYVRVHLDEVPHNVITHVLNRIVPPNLVALLKYERKMTVMNLLIKRLQDSNFNNPIKSKDELIFYVGFRKFKAKPLFSNHSASSKFKYERFLQDDVAMVATIYAPITFPPAPVLVFREDYKGGKELVASGSVLDSNPSRLVVKRIRLSGHPFKIYSKSAVVRFMFFNSEDVNYFKPVELNSKYNRRGLITEALGTHGHMKCLFDRKIRSDDCIFMNLYKRVFPKWTYAPISMAL